MDIHSGNRKVFDGLYRFWWYLFARAKAYLAMPSHSSKSCNSSVCCMGETPYMPIFMHQAALFARIAPDHLSFSDALELVGDAIDEVQMTAHEQLPLLRQRLLRDLAEATLPLRRFRSNQNWDYLPIVEGR
ncbi:MAG: hypothetical protein R2867_09735 [Caldilineaceae bacterium]